MSFLRANISAIFLSLISAGGFILLTILVLTGKSVFIDKLVLNTITIFQTPDLTNVMLSLSFVFHPVFLLLSLFVLFLILIFFKKKTLALFFLLTIILSIASAVLFKMIFNIPRPESLIVEAFGPGFPSTHATAATVFFLTLFYVVRHKIRDRSVSFLFEVVAVVLIILCGVSRLYLSVHWPTDVLAGFFLGFFWVALAVLKIKKYEIRKDERIM